MVKLQYYSEPLNLGDQLSPVITNWISRKIHDKSMGNINLLSVGSILAADFFRGDAVVWGTGIHYVEDAGRLAYYSKDRNLDIRAVRGPITRRALEHAGYPCPHIYGDPAILMPFIYTPKSVKKQKTVVIRQLLFENESIPEETRRISVATCNYKKFIDDLVSAERIISSSLHGIILGESYGIPSVWLVEHETQEFIKYFDWYYSTGRFNIKITHSIEEAMRIVPMELPNLNIMKNKLIEAFPIEIYQNNILHPKPKKKEVVLFGMGKCFEKFLLQIKNRVKVRYVCDNEKMKWGSNHKEITCISFEQLCKMKDVYVVITIEDEKNIKQVIEQLNCNGVYFYETVFSWLRYMNYERFV